MDKTITDLIRAIEHINASEDSEDSEGQYLYYEQGTQRWYRVTADQLRDLGASLRAGTPDAYSLWCAGTVAEEMPRDWTPGLAPAIRALTEAQIRALRNEASEAGDLAQVVICDRALGTEDGEDDYGPPSQHEGAAFRRALAMTQEEALVQVVIALRDAAAAA